MSDGTLIMASHIDVASPYDLYFDPLTENVTAGPDAVWIILLVYDCEYSILFPIVMFNGKYIHSKRRRIHRL